jgi:hypothetical protein
MELLVLLQVVILLAVEEVQYFKIQEHLQEVLVVLVEEEEVRFILQQQEQMEQQILEEVVEGVLKVWREEQVVLVSSS